MPPPGINTALDCTLEELIGRGDTTDGIEDAHHNPMRRRAGVFPRQRQQTARIVRSDSNQQGPRSRGLSLRSSRSLDLAVKGVMGKRTKHTSPRPQHQIPPAPMAMPPPPSSPQQQQQQQQQQQPLPPPGQPGMSYVALPPGYVVAPYSALRSQAKHPKKLSPGEAALLNTTVEQRESGDVVVSFKSTEIITVKADSGDIILTSGGYRTFSTKAVLNQALQPVGLMIEEQKRSNSEMAMDDQECETTTEWIVSDGRSFLQSFHDGMVVRQVGSLSKQQMLARGSVILQFLRQKKTTAEHINTRHRAVGKRRIA